MWKIESTSGMGDKYTPILLSIVVISAELELFGNYHVKNGLEVTFCDDCLLM